MTNATEVKAEKPRRRLLILLPLIVFGALALLFVTRLIEGDPSRVPSVLIGRAVPKFDLPPLDGLVRDGARVPGLATADLQVGKVMLVNVWASWCVPCRQEHPLLTELARDPRVTVVGINYKDSPENARRFLGALGNPFARVGADTSGRTGIDWGVYGVPETFVVAGDGTIRHKHIGPLTSEAIATTLEKAIAEAAALKH
ncbi:DsbE family thiol:disulfide interchange protein [Pseudochelatococcus sp. G4_1912]|uniref:DsbE family thiol:disulfide interchange protein n=1 Tax=Pseudochelatococcus sp. G4_1912 TaxID=3114288 RepID=UPI0039C5ABF3